MIDPFRAELTAGYIVRENHSWSANERLARTGRPRTAIGARLASLFGLIAREVAPRPRPEVQMLPRRERPAA